MACHTDQRIRPTRGFSIGVCVCVYECVFSKCILHRGPVKEPQTNNLVSIQYYIGVPVPQIRQNTEDFRTQSHGTVQ